MNAVEFQMKASCDEMGNVLLTVSGLLVAFFDVIVNDKTSSEAVQPGGSL